MKNTEIIIDWDKNFFVYSLTVATFYKHLDETDKIHEDLKNLKSATWSIDMKNEAEVGDYLLIKVKDN